MNQGVEAITTIASGIIAVTIVAILVSNKARTGQVLGAAGSAFANALSAATAPVTGTSATPNVNGPTSGFSTSSLLGGGVLSGNLMG